MISKLVTLAVGICLLSLNAQAKHYCAEDSDCAALGDLVCTKSQCDWGKCGCPRGQVAKFVGSEMKFRCITLKKIGQSCSTSSTGGICGPENSECRDNICQCSRDDDVAIWDGERCGGDGYNDSPYPGETCDISLANDPCVNSNCRVGDGSVSEGLDGLAGTCTCDQDERVHLSNDLDENTFLGRQIPTCVDNAYGDFCLTTADCASERGLKCDLNAKRCICENVGHKPTPAGSCRAESTSELGDDCAINNDCDPTKNLKCGDVCDLAWQNDNTVQKKCACEPGYVPNAAGTACIEVEQNADCVGDYSCKSLGPNAVCINGQCKSGSRTILGSMWLVVLGYILSRWF